MEELNKEFHELSTKMYSQANAGAEGAGFDPNNMGGAGAQGAPNDDNVVDADFTQVD